MIRLGVNIDHVATLRQARGESYPDPVQAAVMAELGGADNITCHLREDRRHIQDRDVWLLKDTIKVPLNFEMAVTSEMIKIAKKLRPHAVTLVPEKREERTTEGGLDLKRGKKTIASAIDILQSDGIIVSLFIEPTLQSVHDSHSLGAKAVEFHTGDFCHTMAKQGTTRERNVLASKLAIVASEAQSLGCQAHFGHGLNYTNANWLQLVSAAEEANIGHAIVARSVFVGLAAAVSEMKSLLNDIKHRPFLPEGNLSSKSTGTRK